MSIQDAGGSPVRHTRVMPEHERPSPPSPAPSPAATLTGPWELDRVAEFLESAKIPVRLATVGKQSPLVQSLWFLYAEDAIWCATTGSALVVRRIEANPEVGFEIAGDSAPYRGVRGRGTASIDASAAEPVLKALLDRYGFTNSQLGDWLMSRVSTEVAIRISPAVLTSWDFSDRM